MSVVLETNLLAAYFGTIASRNRCEFENIFRLRCGTSTSYTVDNSKKTNFESTFLYIISRKRYTNNFSNTCSKLTYASGAIHRINLESF